LRQGPGRVGVGVFAIALVIGLGYLAVHLINDLSHVHSTTMFPFVLLGIALLVALGFEFVNGFHDTANAVATVIYTHSLDPHVAVVWSGMWNFIGVVLSTGAVAFGIGKDHLSYAQRASAELTAMATIGAADYFGLPGGHLTRKPARNSPEPRATAACARISLTKERFIGDSFLGSMMAAISNRHAADQSAAFLVQPSSRCARAGMTMQRPAWSSRGLATRVRQMGGGCNSPG
jgi:hypothetical protein